MSGRFIYAAVVALLLTYAAPAHAAAPSEAFQKRVEELVRWIAEHSDYPVTVQKMPEFVFLPPWEISRISRTVSLGYKTPSDVWAAQSTGTIYLPDSFALGRDDYVLVHELVHHLQDEAGKKFRCIAEREHEAYTLQIKFTEETGLGADQKPNDIYMKFLRCDIRE